MINVTANDLSNGDNDCLLNFSSSFYFFLFRGKKAEAYGCCLVRPSWTEERKEI